MSDEEEFDEFPSITVNSSIHESMSFSMPSAEELATQRAREEACELALLRLREEHLAADRQGAAVAGVTHSDSSGSEGEAALAAAVGALRVRAECARAAPHAARLLAALAPPALRAAVLRLAAEGGERALAERARDLARGLAQSAEARLGPPELQAALAWLCAAAVGGGRAAPRALHLLVDDVADDSQAEEIGSLLRGAGAAVEPTTALELCEALRCGGPRSAGLAREVARAALARLVEPGAEDAAAALPGAWRRLPPPRRYLALQLLARLLPPPGAEGGDARRLLDALANATPPQRAQTADSLKVLVATTKLQVLFHVKK